jgi:23S rRNA maturation mini-RNase III
MRTGHRRQSIPSEAIMASTTRRYSKEEFARRGDAIYEKVVRPHVKDKDIGKFAAIDIETGTYVISSDELKACHKLRAQIPDAQIWMVRVGYRSVHTIGGSLQRENP